MAETTNQKPQTGNCIESWDAAEKLLALVADCELEAQSLQLAADEKKKEIASLLADGLAKVKAKREELEGLLEKFARAHRAEIGPGKCRDLVQGRIGFRNEVKYKWPRALDTLLDNLRAQDLDVYIKTPPAVSTPDKQGVMAHHEELDLKALGVKRLVIEDVFYVDLNIERKK